MKYLFKRQQFNLNTVTTMIIKYETTLSEPTNNVSSYSFQTILDCEANKVGSVSTFFKFRFTTLLKRFDPSTNGSVKLFEEILRLC
jgi:hypothetical protein